jgi:hypothetical protein
MPFRINPTYVPLRPPPPLYVPLSPLLLSVLYGPPLRYVVPYMAFCPLYSPLSSLQPSVPATAPCSLYSPLSPLQPFVPSMALCPLYDPLPPYSSLPSRDDAIYPFRGLNFHDTSCSKRRTAEPSNTSQVGLIL